jgi:hypothetical protein
LAANAVIFLFRRQGTSAALAGPHRRKINVIDHSFFSGSLNPMKLMARNSMLTIPTTRFVKIAMAFSFSGRAKLLAARLPPGQLPII